MKATIRRQLQADRAATGFEFVGSPGSKLAIEENVTRGVRSKHARSVDARQLNVARGPNVRAHQITLNIADTDLPASSFKIDRGADRQLNLEIHITDVATATIIADDVDHESCLGLSRIKCSFAGVHERGHKDLVALPRFNGDRAGDIFQFKANVLAGRKTARNLLLRQSDARRGKDNENRRN